MLSAIKVYALGIIGQTEPPHNRPDSELIFLKSEMPVRVPMPAIVGSGVRP
jgi:hypothetical protein